MKRPELSGAGRTRAAAAAAGAAALAAAAITLTPAVHQQLAAGRVANTNTNTATPSPASCTTNLAPAPGFVLDLCLTSLGSNVAPAVIVKQTGYIASSCQITLGVFDDANNRLDNAAKAARLPCTPGDHDGATLDLSQLTGITANTRPDGSITVHASADLAIDGHETNLGASPTYYAPGQNNSPASATNPATGINKYNAAAAAAWAKANAYTDEIGAINPDCTDFVSFAMQKGGGLPMTADRSFFDRGNKNTWWRATIDGRPGAASQTWTDARYLEEYLTLSGRGTQVNPQDAKPGDLIFVNWGPGGNDTPTDNPPDQDGIDHVGMIISNPDPATQGDIQIAQHSRDTIETLANWRAKNPSLQVWVYSISYS